jgi:hypothetical protein
MSSPLNKQNTNENNWKACATLIAFELTKRLFEILGAGSETMKRLVHYRRSGSQEWKPGPVPNKKKDRSRKFKK